MAFPVRLVSEGRRMRGMSGRVPSRAADVVIVGAGLAGLAAARALSDRHDVVVVEARNRVGGRTVGHTFANGVTVEMGGQWIGPSHGALLALLAELGLETFPTYDQGDGFTIVDGARHPWEDGFLGLSAQAEAEIGRLHGVIDELAQDVPVDAPWRSPNVSGLDRQSVESWLVQATTDPIARRYLRVVTAAIFAAETHELPLLWFLFYVRSGGSLDVLISTSGGAQELRVVGGSHLVAEAMAASLPPESLILDAPVDRVRQTDDAVVVGYPGGEVAARRAIVTLPPALAGRIAYTPALPADRDSLTRAFPMGSVIKFQVLYDEPWWRAQGLSGQVLSFDDPISTTFDNSPPDGGSGVLLAFAEADHARRLGTLDERRRRETVMDCLHRFFGPPPTEALGFAELDWSSEEFTGGCYGGRPAAGVLSSFGHALRAPIGRIRWAGAETSPTSCGYMDGAVRSGLQAAAQVAAAL